MTNLSRRQFIGAAAAAGAGAAVTTLPTIAAAAVASGSPAATIIRNGRVFVGDNANTIAQAVAIGRDGRILTVGSNRHVANYSGPRTEVVDAAGGTVMAGIQDGHVHPMYAGLRALNASLEDAATLTDCVAKEIQGGDAVKALLEYQARRLKVARQIVQSGQGFSRSFRS